MEKTLRSFKIVVACFFYVILVMTTQNISATEVAEKIDADQIEENGIAESEQTIDYENDPEAYKWCVEDEISVASLDNGGYVHNSRYANCKVLDVIDVSKYQGDINWVQVRKSGVEYAFIRVGYRGYRNGSIGEDEKFKTNIQNAINAGIKVGVYFFSQAINENEAVEEANYVLGRINGYDIKLPVVIDFEYANTSNGTGGRMYDANLSPEQATSICNAFCNKVTSSNYTAMIYANKNMLRNHMKAESIGSSYKVWLANYTSQTDYAGRYDFWQYTSKGQVEGISGNVDCSFWYNGEYQTAGQSLTDGVYTIVPEANSSVALDVAGDSMYNIANIELANKDNTISQQFVVKSMGDGKYSIKNLKSGKFLDVQGGGKSNLTNIDQYQDNGYDTQRWYIQSTENGTFKVESTWVLGMYLDVQGGNAVAGTNIELYTANNSSAQKFYFVKTGMNLEDNTWKYYNNGTVDTSYTGMAYNEYGWWYMTNGAVNWNYTGMACNEYGWWYMTNGAVNWNYTGMACNEYGWWYMTNGTLNWNYTGMACNEYGWWYMTNGALDRNYTGMAFNEYGGWYYMNGRIDYQYTGNTEYNGVIYNIVNGHAV